MERLERLERLERHFLFELLNDLNVLNLINEIRRCDMNNNRLLTEHPGRILLEEFLAPKGVSVWHLAKDIGVPVRRIYEIIQGERSINADVAHRLAHYFGMSERYWLDLQSRYDGKQANKLSTDFSRRQSLRYAG
jgi:antitoxin HigA-1